MDATRSQASLPTGGQIEGGAELPGVRPRFALSLPGSDVELSRYSMFVILYATGFLLEMVEHWRYPGFTAAAVLLAVFMVYNTTRLSFLSFLVLTTGYLIIFRFPEVANHVNLLIFCNIALIFGLIYSFARPSVCSNDGIFLEVIQPILQLMIIITFSVAGFHKLNYDFINPQVSCIADFSRTFYGLLGTSFLGMPAAVTIGLVALATAYLLWRHVPRPTMPKVDVGAILVPGLALVACFFALLTVVDLSTIASPRHLFIFLVAVIILCWQLVEGPLLLVRRFQWFALCLCLLVHAQLAMIGFVDFQSLAIALIMTFVPAGVLDAWNRRRTVSLLGVSMHRVHAYFLLNLIGGFASGFNAYFHNFIDIKVLSGVLFNIGLLILLWPIITDVCSRDRTWRWDGVQVLDRRTPGFLYIFPIALLLFGLTSHFGLRTAGNFSMFSNLRTEGEHSNHLLFRNNPLKFGGYQEDIVTVHQIDDEAVGAGHKFRSLSGYALPVVEFKKLLLLWRENDQVVPMNFEYNGKTYVTDNVVAEPDWQVSGLNWEMKLLDFRLIQPDGPNLCRW